jgi:hypothetical protein
VLLLAPQLGGLTMTEKISYGFVLWAVPRFHRTGVFQEQAYNAASWPEPAPKADRATEAPPALNRDNDRNSTTRFAWH